MQRINFQESVRDANSSDVQTVDIQDIFKALNPTGFRMAESKEGKEYLHILLGEKKDRWFSIGLGKSVETNATTLTEEVKQLVNNHVVFTGTKREDGTEVPRWYSFGKAVDFPEAEVIDFAAVMGTTTTIRNDAKAGAAKV